LDIERLTYINLYRLLAQFITSMTASSCFDYAYKTELISVLSQLGALSSNPLHQHQGTCYRHLRGLLSAMNNLRAPLVSALCIDMSMSRPFIPAFAFPPVDKGIAVHHVVARVLTGPYKLLYPETIT
jgi:hypothetical protein